MNLAEVLFGPPLATEDEKAERIGVAKGIPIFGLDALSSVAYGPEAALTLLIPLGLAGVAYIVPISVSIIVLLGVVYLSYRQTIMAYPQGGGSYTVASENLGVWPGLIAAASLMVDDILTVAVGISAGVGALVSAVPEFQRHTLTMCLAILVFLTFINLRGMRDTGGVFLVPTYLFFGCLLIAIAIGVAKTFAPGGHPVPLVPAAQVQSTAGAVSAWLLLRAFSSGCTAMTGVEAVSNGVMAFREPASETARRTLTWVVAILMVLLGGLAYLIRAYGITATVPGQAGYNSVLSQLIAAIAGKGVFYFVSMGAILVVLSLSANTAFADFPRLSRAIATNGFLPHSLTLRGRRLVFARGIYVLAALAGALLVLFDGITDRLIPLYAVGVFIAFTLSQAGMVMHWKKTGGAGARRNMVVNGVGAAATAATVLVVLMTKFAEGAWVTVLLIPALVAFMRAVKQHYDRVGQEIGVQAPANTADLRPPLVVLPVGNWNTIAQDAVRFAWSISTDIRALHVESGEETDNLRQRWSELVEGPARKAGLPVPELVVLKSPFRFVIAPIVDYVFNLQHENQDRQLAVVVPELVESRWYYTFLHDNRSEILRAMLLFKNQHRVAVITIPWRLKG